MVFMYQTFFSSNSPKPKKENPWSSKFTTSFRLVNKSTSTSPNIPSETRPKVPTFHQSPVPHQQQSLNPSHRPQINYSSQLTQQLLHDLLLPNENTHSYPSNTFTNEPTYMKMKNIGIYHNDHVTLTSGSIYSRIESEFAPIYSPRLHK